MDHKNFRSFSSKILLFGEYLVLQGGQSLSFPYATYSLKRSPEFSHKNRFFFNKLAKYIEQNETLRTKINPEFKIQVNQGLNFESNIPVGYGLGSSGALVAAIYEDYFHTKTTEYKELKFILAEIESFFHKKSSGIDPLTSYLNLPILSSQDSIEVLSNIDLGQFSLYDSGIRRSAKDAIGHFNHLSLEVGFQNDLKDLSVISNVMINNWINKMDILEEIKAYSTLQFKIFRDFIPDKVQLEWKKGLDSQEYYMKLCGAGMGGMYLKWEMLK